LEDPSDLVSAIKSFDEAIFDSVNNKGNGPYWGQYYVNSLNEPEA
jgi:hypothetical protein